MSARAGVPGPLARLGGAAWRIALYGALYLAFALVGGLLVARVGGEVGPLSWGGIGVSLAAALAAGWIMTAGVERRPLGAMGFAPGRAAVRESVLGVAVGAGLIGAAVLPVVLTGDAHWVPDSGSPAGYARVLAGTFAFFALAAALEEVLFRGYPFQVLVNGIGAWPATLLASGLFSWAHLGNPGVTPLALANILLAGVLLSVAYLRTRSLWFATAVHLGWNWTMATLLDFPVSGLPLDTPLYSAVETGADWWTGGPFGPEAGLAATAALALGTAWLLRTRRIGVPEEVRARRPLPDVPFWAGEE